MARAELLAHSARFGCPVQSYREHVSEVARRALINAHGAAVHSPYGDLLISTVHVAALYHDLGKVDKDNQKVLGGKASAPLPINHTDAGTAFLLQKKSITSALCVLAHHRPGLLSIPEENSKVHKFRVRKPCSKEEKTVQEVTDERLAEYIKYHQAVMGPAVDFPEKRAPGTSFLRFALSCLVDADHADTAKHYGKGIDVVEIPLAAENRLACLDAYINSLTTADTAPERIEIRQAFYRMCHEEPQARGLYSCSMPVGTGKTTSVMAHLLGAAKRFNLRKIFVVLPFTNIIDQSVNTYRKSLRLSDENPEAVVAAHHHRAEYENAALMAASFLWDAPITVTTAVQFFETLASNRPAALRKLHNLAGAAVFIDEAHAALPAHLWPQAWKWILDLVNNWGCHIVLGSGSLSHFWNLKEFSDTKINVPEIAGHELYRKAAQLEGNRISYHLKKDPMGLDGLYQWVCGDLQCPRIVIMNTVQSTAALADKIAREQGRHAVEHLSTALTPFDRDITLERIKSRLADKEDTNWTLVATTCAEAGLNLSFRSGAREMSSLGSTLQLGGRVNRQCEYGSNCEVWCFYIKKDECLRDHKQFKTSAQVLRELFDEKNISSDFCTDALRREVRIKNTGAAKDDPIVRAEKRADYPSVSELFQVIEDNQTFTIVIDEGFKERLENGQKPTRKDMQTLTVRMRQDQIDTLRLPRIRGYEDLYFCYPDYYDDFLGYMRGILQTISVLQNGSIV